MTDCIKVIALCVSYFSLFLVSTKWRQAECTIVCHIGKVWVCYLQVQRGIRKVWPGSQVHFSPNTAKFRSLVPTAVCILRRCGHLLALFRCQPLLTGQRNCWRTIGTDPQVGWHPHHRRCAPPRVSLHRIHAVDPQCTPAHLEEQLGTRLWPYVGRWREVQSARLPKRSSCSKKDVSGPFAGPAESSSHSHLLLLPYRLSLSLQSNVSFSGC
jgi:hypothetical protein